MSIDKHILETEIMRGSGRGREIEGIREERGKYADCSVPVQALVLMVTGSQAEAETPEA